jgi:acetylornithine deacetylase/succinyl-diaminopimelate desuccinylase-like protein
MTQENLQKALTQYQLDSSYLFQELIKFLQIPSVSNADNHKADILKAAAFLIKKLEQIGFNDVKAYPTALHPIIYGEFIVDPEVPTILIYGHYDVQPPDPLDEWHSPPFEPFIQGDYLHARGASDMKGQIWAIISSLQSILKIGELNINIKFLLEGEEEIGSPSLNTFLEDHKARLTCDMVLNPDSGMIGPDKPTIVYGLRGLAYFELRIFGAKADLHSGSFGGVIPNPANVLSKLIAGMHDENGRISLPGFYDNVRNISDNERTSLMKLGMNEPFYLRISGAKGLSGEKGYLPVERTGARPTLDVNGLYSGFIEKGAKTIIPAYATAKISCRLVPDQDPVHIHKSLRSYLEQRVPSYVSWELNFMSGAPAYINEDHTPGLENLRKALQDTWKSEVVLKREGGSIPVATSMKKILGVDSIITGFGLPDDQIHSPNERLHLPTHKKGIEALIRFFISFNTTKEKYD